MKLARLEMLRHRLAVKPAKSKSANLVGNVIVRVKV